MVRHRAMHPRGMAASLELSTVLEVADQIATESGEVLDSGHLLLALFTVNSRARAVLEERGITEDALVDARPFVGPEPVDSIPVIHYKTAQVAEGSGTNLASSLHLLVGLCRVSSSTAYGMLERAGVAPSELRTAAIATLTRGLSRRSRIPTARP